MRSKRKSERIHVRSRESVKSAGRAEPAPPRECPPGVKPCEAVSDRTKIILLLAPALTVIVVLFFGGLALGVLRSLNYMPVIGLTEPNLDACLAVFTSREFHLSFVLTFHIAFTSKHMSSKVNTGGLLICH